MKHLIKELSIILTQISLFLFPLMIRASELVDINAQKELTPPSQNHTSMDAPKDVQATFKREDFKPYMLKHYNEGCPTNSTCTKEMGRRYKKWSKALRTNAHSKKITKALERFRKKNGIPFEVWITKTDKHHPDLIAWEGNCNYHNREGEKKIKIGVAMIKNIDDLNGLEKEKIIATRKLYRLNVTGNKVTRYRIPQNDTPLYLDGDNLIYQRSEDGIYFGLSITPAGKLAIVDTITPPEFPKSLACPKLLKEAQKDHPEDFEQEIYAGVYCQKTWNRSRKKFETLLLGWSCD